MICHICPHCETRLESPKRCVGSEVVCGKCGKGMECPRVSTDLSANMDGDFIPSTPPEGYGRAGDVNLVVTLACLSYFCTGPLTAFPAMVLGHLNLHCILRGKAPRTHLTRTLWGLFLAYTNLALFFLFFMPMMAILSQVHEASGRNLCIQHLKDMGGAFKAFSAAHNGAYPKLSDVPGQLMCAPDGICPEFVKEPFWFVCVRSPMMQERNKRHMESCALVNDECYFYLGHAVTNDAEVEAFCNGYREATRSGTSWKKALRVPLGQGFEGSDVIPLLDNVAEGMAARVPVIIERSRNHPGGGHGVGWFFARMWDSDSSITRCYESGGHVLYLDGHVEYKKYPGEWPMTEKTVQALEKIHALQQEQK